MGGLPQQPPAKYSYAPGVFVLIFGAAMASTPFWGQVWENETKPHKSFVPLFGWIVIGLGLYSLRFVWKTRQRGGEESGPAPLKFFLMTAFWNSIALAATWIEITRLRTSAGWDAMDLFEILDRLAKTVVVLGVDVMGVVLIVFTIQEFLAWLRFRRSAPT